MNTPNIVCTVELPATVAAQAEKHGCTLEEFVRLSVAGADSLVPAMRRDVQLDGGQTEMLGKRCRVILGVWRKIGLLMYGHSRLAMEYDLPAEVEKKRVLGEIYFSLAQSLEDAVEEHAPQDELAIHPLLSDVPLKDDGLPSGDAP